MSHGACKHEVESMSYRLGSRWSLVVQCVMRSQTPLAQGAGRLQRASPSGRAHNQAKGDIPGGVAQRLLELSLCLAARVMRAATNAIAPCTKT